MSNSIWKTGNLQEADTRKQILFYAGGGQFLYLGWNHPALGMILAGSADWKYGDIQKWCYLDDLITQADKAKRLQKAVDYVLDSLQSFMETGYLYTDVDDVILDIQATCNEIKQLTKGGN